jgi:hypothetical protein
MPPLPAAVARRESPSVGSSPSEIEVSSAQAAKSEGKVIPFVHRQFRVSYFIQFSKALGFKVMSAGRLPSPPDPKRPTQCVCV